jgi:hypothetical protein
MGSSVQTDRASVRCRDAILATNSSASPPMAAATSASGVPSRLAVLRRVRRARVDGEDIRERPPVEADPAPVDAATGSFTLITSHSEALCSPQRATLSAWTFGNFAREFSSFLGMGGNGGALSIADRFCAHRKSGEAFVPGRHCQTHRPAGSP